MGFKRDVDKLVDYVAVSRPSVDTVTVAVTEKTARRALKLKKKDPLVYRGMSLRCIGSRRYRLENPQ